MNQEVKELKRRWINILRVKASEYEHDARQKGKVVVEPSIDVVCNELEAFFIGLNNSNK